MYTISNTVGILASVITCIQFMKIIKKQSVLGFVYKKHYVIPIFEIIAGLLIYTMSRLYTELFKLIVQGDYTWIHYLSVALVVGLVMIDVCAIVKIVVMSAPKKHRRLYYICQWISMTSVLCGLYILTVGCSLEGLPWRLAIAKYEALSLIVIFAWVIPFMILLNTRMGCKEREHWTSVYFELIENIIDTGGKYEKRDVINIVNYMLELEKKTIMCMTEPLAKIIEDSVRIATKSEMENVVKIGSENGISVDLLVKLTNLDVSEVRDILEDI